MAIEIQTRPKKKENIGQFIFSFVCIVIIIFLLGSFAYFSFFIPKIEKEIEQKNREINIIKSERSVEQEGVIYLKKKIDNFKKILPYHYKAVGIFELVENFTHPEVWFSSFDANIEKGEILLSGSARNFVVLAQQMFLLQKNEFIKEIKLSGVSTDEEGVSFSLFLNVDSRILK